MRKKEIEIRPGTGPTWHQFEEPSASILRTFNRPGEGPAKVTFRTHEVTALCPLSGQPDFYTIEIVYVPDALCVESKSAKFYLGSFRNVGAFAETIADTILRDWVKACSPLEATVFATMVPRGGIAIAAERSYHA